MCFVGTRKIIPKPILASGQSQITTHFIFVDPVIWMATARRCSARCFYNGFDKKTRYDGSFGFRCYFFCVNDFLGCENDSFFRRACHFNVELLVAQDLRVSLCI